MIIRDYKETDKNVVISFLEGQTDELITHDPFSRKRLPGYGEHSINELLSGNEGKNKVLVAEENGEVLGYSSGWVKIIDNFTKQSGAPNTNGMFDNLYVKPTARGKGIAKALTQAMEKYFKENDCTLIWLNVYAMNTPAVNLYSKLGYMTNTLTMIKKFDE